LRSQVALRDGKGNVKALKEKKLNKRVYENGALKFRRVEGCKLYAEPFTGRKGVPRNSQNKPRKGKSKREKFRLISPRGAKRVKRGGVLIVPTQAQGKGLSLGKKPVTGPKLLDE